MKRTQLITFLLALLIGFAPAVAAAASSSGMAAPDATSVERAAPAMSAKEQKRSQRLKRKLDRKMDKMQAKAAKKGRKGSALEGNLRKAVIFAIIAVALSVVSSILYATVALSLVGYLAWIAAGVFWILAVIKFVQWAVDEL